jgi:hypothetical protein
MISLLKKAHPHPDPQLSFFSLPPHELLSFAVPSHNRNNQPWFGLVDKSALRPLGDSILILCKYRNCFRPYHPSLLGLSSFIAFLFSAI